MKTQSILRVCMGTTKSQFFKIQKVHKCMRICMCVCMHVWKNRDNRHKKSSVCKSHWLGQLGIHMHSQTHRRACFEQVQVQHDSLQRNRSEIPGFSGGSPCNYNIQTAKSEVIVTISCSERHYLIIGCFGELWVLITCKNKDCWLQIVRPRLGIPVLGILGPAHVVNLCCLTKAERSSILGSFKHTGWVYTCINKLYFMCIKSSTSVVRYYKTLCG